MNYICWVSLFLDPYAKVLSSEPSGLRWYFQLLYGFLIQSCFDRRWLVIDWETFSIGSKFEGVVIYHLYLETGFDSSSMLFLRHQYPKSGANIDTSELKWTSIKVNILKCLSFLYTVIFFRTTQVMTVAKITNRLKFNLIG